MSGEHARIIRQPGRVVLHDLHSTNGTTVVHSGERRRLSGEMSATHLETGDLIELGSGDEATTLRVTVHDDVDEAHILSMRRLDELAPAAAKIERDPGALSALYAAQKRIVAANDLDDVLIEVADAVLFLLPSSTHVTIVLRDDELAGDATAAAFVPVMTRIRLPSGMSGPPSGPVAITRAVYRRVVADRAAVLAADAPNDVGQTESMLGAFDPKHARRSTLEG